MKKSTRDKISATMKVRAAERSAALAKAREGIPDFARKAVKDANALVASSPSLQIKDGIDADALIEAVEAVEKAKPKRNWIGRHTFEPANPWAWKKGQSGNPAGKPRIISEAYREFLLAEDENGVTNAAKIAFMQGAKAIITADTFAAQEIRKTTEGDVTVNFISLDDNALRERIRRLEARVSALLGSPSSVQIIESSPREVEESHDEQN
jgi:hypothetical protein